MMNDKDSSEEEEPRNISAFSKFDESIEVRNAEEIKSPINTSSITKIQKLDDDDKSSESGSSPPIAKLPHPPRFASKSGVRGMTTPFEKTKRVIDDLSDSEETDDEELPPVPAKPIETYNPMEFEDLHVSAEVKELFENIVRFSPQQIHLNYKLIPFIPEYIPAVGDIDAFIKIPRPDKTEDKIGLVVLDEPCANQSEPAVLHLQLRNYSKSAVPANQILVKKIEAAEKNVKAIDKWINDMNQLYRSKHAPTVQIWKPAIDMDALMQQWGPEMDGVMDKDKDEVDFTKSDCSLLELVDIACKMVDIPVHADARIEALHALFSLFLEDSPSVIRKVAQSLNKTLTDDQVSSITEDLNFMNMKKNE